MRIVAGKHKGRPLSAPKGRDTRPTSDRAREAIFNVLDHGPGPGLNGARVADLFAGTGALGLEALSRGAEHCIFVESQRGAMRTLRDNIHLLGEDAATTLVDKKAANIAVPPGGPVDYAFLDAPYDQGLSEPALQALAENGWLNDNCVILVEVAKSEALSPPPGFEVIKEKTYGAARAVFLTFHA
ncbi:16S rRNA (guanine(966)-N(2))-methyltransferase RsmD [Pseudomonadota bacterium]